MWANFLTTEHMYGCTPSKGKCAHELPGGENQIADLEVTNNGIIMNEMF